MKILFKINFLFYIVTFIMLITGYFKDALIIMSIILIHEFGHVITGVLLKWKIEKIVILPFGSLTIFNEDLNKPILEEFLILIMGPIFQISLFFLFDNDLVKNYNLSLLVFNLLPIYPLDGSKIFNLFFQKTMPFINSYIVTIFLSIMIIITILFWKLNFIVILVLLFLVIENYKTYLKMSFIFNKFLLERKMKKYNFKKVKIINSIKRMYRGYKHVFYIENKYYSEKEYLNKMFDFKGKI